MNYEEHIKKLAGFQSKHQENLRHICLIVTQDIFNETLRLNTRGIDTTLTLATTQLSVYVHRDGDCTVHGASLNNAEGLIELLRHLEETTAKEVQNNAEALS